MSDERLTPADLARLEGALPALLARVRALEAALETIAAWTDFPTTDHNGKELMFSFGFHYGSNGERDHMRGVARKALRAKGGPDAAR